MPIEKENLAEAYRIFLEREVESDAMHQWYDRTFEDIWAALRHIRKSPEFKWRNSEAFHVNAGFTYEEFARCAAWSSRPFPRGLPDFATNFIGQKTRCEYWNELKPLAGRSFPLGLAGTPGGDIVEWIALTKTVERAEKRFVMAELGAAWGPWIAAGALLARRREIEEIRLVAVEADDERYGRIAEHLEDNGLSDLPLRALHGIAAPKSGWAQFPVLDDSAHDMGPSAIFTEERPQEGRQMDRRGIEYPYVLKRAFSLEEIFADEPRFDAVHFDVQGAELEILESGIDLVDQRCAHLIIGTHSREIEGGIARLMMDRGWLLENERPCTLLHGKFGPASDRDGTQLWKNPKLVQQPAV